MESTTKRVSCGFNVFFKLLISSIIFSSIANLPAVSIITDLNPLDFACLIAFFAIFNGDLDFLSEKTSILRSSPITCNCSIAAGLYTSHATNKVFLPFLVRYLPNFPVNVVLPDP